MTTLKTAPLLGSCRLAVCLMNGVAMLVACLLGVSISLSIVCMVRKPDSIGRQPINDSIAMSRDVNETTSTPSSTDFSPLYSTDYNLMTKSTVKKQTYRGEFQWSRSFQGHVLSSYFYGVLSTILIGGWLAGRYGAKHVIGCGLLVSSVAAMIIPSAVRLNDYLIIPLRVIMGMALGPVFTVCMNLSGLWYPPHERSSLVSISCLGVTLGNILAFLLPAQFCSVAFDNGWPLTFYVTGGTGIVSWVLWNIFVYSSPGQHPRISQREKDYLSSSTGVKSSIAEKPPMPWCRVLSSTAVWAIIGAQTSNLWFIYTALTSLPLYMKEVLHFDIRQNSMWLILPQLLTLLFNVPCGYLADTIIKRNICSVSITRKVCQLASSWISPALLISIAFLSHEQRYLAVGLLSSITPIQSLCRSGYVANCIDIAPRYSGEIFSLSNTLATLSGVFAPMVVGSLTTNGTKQEWQTVFFIASGIFFGGGVIFLLFSEGTVLPWADSVAVAEQSPATKSDSDLDPSPMETSSGCVTVELTSMTIIQS